MNPWRDPFSLLAAQSTMEPSMPDPPLYICSQSKCQRVVIQDGPKPLKTCKQCRETNTKATAARRKRTREKEAENMQKRARTDGSPAPEREGREKESESDEEGENRQYVCTQYSDHPRSKINFCRPSHSSRMLRHYSRPSDTPSKPKKTSNFVGHTRLWKIHLLRTKNVLR